MLIKAIFWVCTMGCKGRQMQADSAFLDWRHALVRARQDVYSLSTYSLTAFATLE